MNKGKFFSVFMILFALNACSSSVPNKISELQYLQLPVVVGDINHDNAIHPQIENYYKNNTKIINEITFYLKAKYLKNGKMKDVFDVHSRDHKIYRILTVLEEAQDINELYFSSQNIKGLIALQEKLEPYHEIIDTHILKKSN